MESKDTRGPLPVSDFRFDSDAFHADLKQEAGQFFHTASETSFRGVVPFQGQTLPLRIAQIFVMGVSGILILGVVVDSGLLILQRR